MCAARAELVEMCIELGLDWQGLSIQQMKMAIRERVDRKMKYKTRIKKGVGDKDFSKELIKFLTEEYDYKLIDREGKEVKI